MKSKDFQNSVRYIMRKRIFVKIYVNFADTAFLVLLYSDRYTVGIYFIVINPLPE